jgi:hypothetical protein
MNMKNIDDLINQLEQLKLLHGNIQLGSILQIEVSGISYKYLIVKSNHPTYYPQDLKNELSS